MPGVPGAWRGEQRLRLRFEGDRNCVAGLPAAWRRKSWLCLCFEGDRFLCFEAGEGDRLLAEMPGARGRILIACFASSPRCRRWLTGLSVLSRTGTALEKGLALGGGGGASVETF